MFEKVKECAGNVLKKGKLAAATIGGGTAAAALTVMASAEGSGTTFSVPKIADNITQASFNGIMEQITSILPIILPVVIGVLAFRKGLSFLIGMIRGL